MDEYEELDLRARSAGSFEDSASVLADLLGGSYAVWDDGSLYSIKQLVAHVRGLQIHVYANEHAPPHFHVRAAGINASFAIDDCRHLAGEIGGREENLIRWWYERSRPQVVAAWNNTRPSDCLVGPVCE